MKSKLKIVFMGTPDFSVPSLKEINKIHNVIRVYTQPPRPFGRGLKEKISPIHKFANENNLDVSFPSNFRNNKEVDELKELNPDFIVVVAYGLILPGLILQIPKFLSLNGHASKLPRWRGAAPIHRALEEGDKITAVEAMIMEETLDTGSIVFSKDILISDNDTFKSLHDRLSKSMPKVLLKAIDSISNNNFSAIQQNNSGITYAKKIDPSEKFLNWKQNYTSIKNKLRAFTPWPGIWVTHNGNKLRIHSINKYLFNKDYSNFKPGQIVGFSDRKSPIVITNDYKLFEINQIQRQGGIKMNSAEFIKGYNMQIGDIFK
tara:strand:+ start:219 stop:1172 length:954 start_codon:yes stop_codon:yes gene_type:complete